MQSANAGLSCAVDEHAPTNPDPVGDTVEDGLVSNELEIAAAIAREPQVREVVSTVSGSAPGRELTEWISDVIRGRRARTQIRILERTAAAIRQANLPADVVPAKILTTLLEFAGLEDAEDHDMIERWANMLANAATRPDTQHVSFPSILASLEPVEVRMLDAMHDALSGEVNAESETTHRLEGFSPAWFEERGLVDRWGYAAAAGNLLRLQLLERGGRNDPPYLLNLTTNALLSEPVQITHFGAAFVVACQPPQKLKHRARIDGLMVFDPRDNPAS